MKLRVPYAAILMLAMLGALPAAFRRSPRASAVRSTRRLSRDPPPDDQS